MKEGVFSLQVSTSSPSGNGKGVSVSSAGTAFPTCLVPKDVLRGHFLEWLLEIPPAVSPVSLATFLMQKENEAGTTPSTRKLKTKRAKKPSVP